ncbi:MAG: hypothetical protein GEU81_08815 [Nitriliruptorales bacterium]|nr:hypothetical protein [Nitriliruptorales bacterium]
MPRRRVRHAGPTGSVRRETKGTAGRPLTGGGGCGQRREKGPACGTVPAGHRPRRGRRPRAAPPLLTVTDGAPGLISAVEQILPDSLRQRCVIHRSWSLLAKVSQVDQAEVKADYWAIFDDIDTEAGEPAVAQARRRAAAFDDKWRSKYPSAVACVTHDPDTLTAHLRFPRDHWRSIRHTNLIERTSGETRHRVKVIARLPGERSCRSPRVGGAGPCQPRVAGCRPDPRECPPAPAAAPRPARPRAADDPEPEPVAERDLPDTVTPAA